MFVALTDFSVNPYLIPSKPENANGITSFIDRTEKDILEKMLGLTFYRALVEGVNALPAEWVTTTNYLIGAQVVYGSEIYQAVSAGSGNIPGVSGQWTIQPANRWLKLKKGNTYTHKALENNWAGMKEMLTPYVHALYLRDYDDSITATGLVKHVSENSEPVSILERYVRGYNEFSNYVGKPYSDSYKNSLYGYLYYTTSFDADMTPKGYASMQSYLCENFKFGGYENRYGL